MNSVRKTKSRYFSGCFEYEFSKEWLEEKYIRQELSVNEIGEIVGCSGGTVWRNLKKYNISRRKRTDGKSPITRFWKGIKSPREPHECWEWIKTKNKRGYGLLSVNRKYVMAHRFSWELFNHEIPEGLYILHRCDNPSCVNPSHLFLGTKLDNSLDALHKGRIPRGEDKWCSKLSENEVIEIIKRHNNNESRKDIAKDYDVCPWTIRDIVTGRTWKHIQRGK